MTRVFQENVPRRSKRIPCSTKLPPVMVKQSRYGEEASWMHSQQHGFFFYVISSLKDLQLKTHKEDMMKYPQSKSCRNSLLFLLLLLLLLFPALAMHRKAARIAIQHPTQCLKGLCFETFHRSTLQNKKLGRRKRGIGTCSYSSLTFIYFTIVHVTCVCGGIV